MNSEINTQINVLPPFKYFCSTIGELPSSYLESMTYYETVVWLCNYLKETIIPTVNNTGSAVTELQDLYIELENYVNTYFDNLNVQEEINNKLDQMASDGTLTNLISNYVEEYINPLLINMNSRINTNTQNISENAFNINTQKERIDAIASLPAGSTSGDAEIIDARIGSNGVNYDSLGDSIRSQISNIDNKFFKKALSTDFEWGLYTLTPSNGTITSSTNRIAMTNFIYCLKGSSITIDEGYKFNICVLNKNATGSGNVLEYRLFNTTDYVTSYDGFLRVGMAKSDDTDLSDTSISSHIHINALRNNYINEATFNLNKNNIEDEIENFKDQLFSAVTLSSWELGSLNANGTTSESTTRIITSNPIYCTKGSTITVNSGYKFNLGMYSSENLTSANLIEYVSMRTSDYTILNDCYIRIGMGNNDNTSVEDYIDETSSNINLYLYGDKKFVSNENYSNLEEQIINLIDNDDIEWELGTINYNGNTGASSTRIRTKNAIYVNKGSKIRVNNGYKFNCACYLINPAISNSLLEFKNLNSDSFTINEDCFIKIAMGKTDDSTLTNLVDETAKNINLYLFTNKIKDEKHDNIYKGKELTFIPSELYHFTGTVPSISLIPTESYNPLTYLYGLYDDLVSEYSDYISKDVLGMDESDTYEIRCYTVGNYTDNKQKILWLAGIHPGEHSTLMSTYQMAKELIINHDNDPLLSFLWSNCYIKIVPVVNPWGLANHKSRVNVNGVNLNRNFNAEWTYSDVENLASGEYPESEAETQVIVNFLNNNKDCLFAVNKHDSYSITEGNGNLCYMKDDFSVDKLIIASIFNNLDTSIKKYYPEIINERPASKEINIFRTVQDKGSNFGTMDEWFNMQGIHGGLIEVANEGGSDYSDITSSKIRKINMDIIFNIICGFLSKNQTILNNDHIDFLYPETEIQDNENN